MPSQLRNPQWYRFGTELFPYLEEQIAAAQTQILIALFSFRADKVGQRFISLLGERAKAGIDVRVIFDAVPSQPYTQKVNAELSRQGIKCRVFRQFSLSWLFHSPSFWCRSHARLFLFDSKVLGVGGASFGEQYLDREDLSVFSEIPDASLAQEYFSYLWYAADSRPGPFLRNHSQELLISGPREQEQHIQEWLGREIERAHSRVVIMSPFFFPPRALLQKLIDAKKRGVEVEVISPLRTDRPYYDPLRTLPGPILLRYGITWRGTSSYFHQKIVIIDDKWLIGSANFDILSLQRNYELSRHGDDPIVMGVLEKIISEAREKAPRLSQFDGTPFMFRRMGSISYAIAERILSLR